MSDVSETVLAGRLRLATEAKIIRPGERMLCPEAMPMWDVVTGPYFAGSDREPLTGGVSATDRGGVSHSRSPTESH